MCTDRLPFSPGKHLHGQTVLLTGGLGFLGSVVLEQLLRLTEVRRVYLLVRSKRTATASKRVDDLLCSPLFHMLHTDALQGTRNVFTRVAAVEGDLGLPGMGLSSTDAQTLKDEVDIVIHCAANLELDADVQKIFRDNYLCTKALMQLASGFTNLKAFLHTSTYFVNNHLPRNTEVKEQIYPIPLTLAGRPVDCEQYVQSMMEMTPEEANMHTNELMQQYNFTSTYAFSKHLAERMFDSTTIRPGVAKAIVRPALISAVAQDPYPGYMAGYAGSNGYIMGFATGFFQHVQGIAYGSDYQINLIPCDTVAALTTAAAAAAAARYGRLGADSSAVIYHAATAKSHPFLLGEGVSRMHNFWTLNPPPLCLPGTSYPLMEGKHKPSALGVLLCTVLAQLKVLLVAYMLKLAGKPRESKALKNSFKAFTVHNKLAYDRSIMCAVDNARALQAQMSPEDRAAWKVVFCPSVMSWDDYFYTYQAGVRRLLFRISQDVTGVQHMFVFRQGTLPSTLKLGAASRTSSMNSSNGLIEAVFS